VRVRDSERKRGETRQNASTSCVLLQRKEKEKIQASRNQKTSSQVESSQVIGERKVDSVYRTKVKERQEKRRKKILSLRESCDKFLHERTRTEENIKCHHERTAQIMNSGERRNQTSKQSSMERKGEKGKRRKEEKKKRSRTKN